MIEKFLSFLSEIQTSGKKLHCVASSPKSKEIPKKVALRPFTKKNALVYQKSYTSQNKEFHETIDPKNLEAALLELLKNYSQLQLSTEDFDLHVLTSKKGKITVLKKPATLTPQSDSHNAKKKNPLDIHEDANFLKHLGFLKDDGTLIQGLKHKFEQVQALLESFLHLLKDLNPPTDRPLKVIELACGKAYLSFSLCYLLQKKLNLPVELWAIDTKPEVIRFNQKLTSSLNIECLHFEENSIENFTPPFTPDLVIALHACNTASDLVIAKTVKWTGKSLMLVPCCHQELLPQIKCPPLDPLLRFGIFKERFASLVTDATRALLLEENGYHVTAQEFVDSEHTGKNLLLRALLRSKRNNSSRYAEWKEFLHINPKLKEWLP